jgi:hypothetical protein
LPPLHLILGLIQKTETKLGYENSTKEAVD